MSAPPGTEALVLEGLAKLPIFMALNARSRRKLAKLCSWKTFEAGDVIFEEGALGLSIFVVTSGRAERYRSRDGTKVRLGSVEAGGVLGEVALLDDRPRSASAAALEPTECLLLTRDSLGTLIKKEPRIAWCLVPGLAGRVRELQGLAVESELALRRNGNEESAEEAAAPARPATVTETEPDGPSADREEEESDLLESEAAEPESAFLEVLRVQLGLLAGGAKGMTEMAKMMESFLDSLAEETEIKPGQAWHAVLARAPNAMITATRKAMEQGNKAVQEVVDAFRRHRPGKR